LQQETYRKATKTEKHEHQTNKREKKLSLQL